jgi:hypothetical protein
VGDADRPGGRLAGLAMSERDDAGAPGASTMQACQGSSASFNSRRLQAEGESV